MESFDWHGQWKLPTSDRGVGGTLRYSDTYGLRLSLFGLLTPGIQDFASSKDYPLIHGITTDGKWITLARCLASESSWSSSGTGSEHIWAHECAVGAHFESLEELEFDRAKLKFRFLGDWVDTTGITSATRGSFSYDPPGDLLAEMPNARILLGFDADFSGRRHQLSIQETPIMVVEASSALPIHQFDSALYRPLRHLFTLIFGRPSPVDEIILYSPHGVYEVRKDQRAPIQYIRQPLSLPSGRSLTRAFLPYSWVRGKWEAIVPAWFKIAEELEPVLNLFFSLHDMEHTFMEPRFLMAVQALEGYHRGRFPNEVLLLVDYRAKVSEILDRLPEKLRNWTKTAFDRVGNEPSLRDRLSALLEKAQKMLLGTVDVATFPSTVTKTRNKLTHYDPKLRTPGPNGETLFILAEQSRLVLETLLLLELGASDEEAIQFIADSERAERIRQLQHSA